MAENTGFGMQLIIMGNKNINTFANTLRGIEKHWKNSPIEAVYLFRIESDTNERILDWRELCYDLLPRLSRYCEIIIPDNATYATAIPRLMRQLFIEQNINQDFVIVDMTNGTKTWCDFVYLVCTLMQVTNLFRIKAPKEVYDLPYEMVDVSSLNVYFEPVLELEDLQKLIRSTYSEYTCYLKELTEFVNWVRFESSLTLDSGYLYERLLNAFEHYMRLDYSACIVSVATVLEEILDDIFKVMEKRFAQSWMPLINNNPPANSLGSKAHTLGQACIRANYVIAGVENNFTKTIEGESLKKLQATFDFAPLIPTGTLCQSLAMIRNYSGHGNPYSSSLQTETDTRQILHGILYLFGKMRICKLFRRN